MANKLFFLLRMENDALKKESLSLKVQRMENLKALGGNILYAFIMLNVVVICLETVDELNYLDYYFGIFEIVAIIVFSIEYGIRLAWAYTQNQMFSYMFSFLGIIDLISILPFYIPTSSINSGSFRFLKILRMFRFLKIYRHSEHIKIIIEVVQSKIDYLRSFLFATALVLFFCSCSTYYFEHEIQATAFANMFDALWWGICTLTTVGCGIYPVTVGGKIMGAILAVVGIGLVAIPSGILSAGFVEVMEKKKKGNEDNGSGK